VVEFRSQFQEVERQQIVDISTEILFSKDGAEALNYLENVRGFSQDVIKKFHLGYLPLYAKCDDGYKHELAGRIIIPVYDQYNKLIILSSRDWREDAKMKFFHETFPKSFYLYGLNSAKKEIIKNKMAIVVEGEFDTIYCHMAGFPCAVGVIGSALQLNQIALLSRYCRDIYIVFDGDQAGLDAIKRVKKIEYEVLLKQFYNINLIYVLMPKDLDPDDYLKVYGSKEFSRLLENSKKLIVGEETSG